MAIDEREKDLFELPETDLRAQLVDDDADDNNDSDDDEEIENTDLEPMRKTKVQGTTWHKPRSRRTDPTNERYAPVDNMDDSVLNDLPMEMQHELLVTFPKDEGVHR